MPAKIFDIPIIGPVSVYKRRGSRSIRLTVAPARTVRVTIPYWATYASGVAFAQTKADWIQSQLDKQAPAILEPGRRIGKIHHLQFQTSLTADTVTSRVQDGEVTVIYPVAMHWDNVAVQTKAQQAGIRALRQEAERALPARLHDLAEQYGFRYHSVSVKQLKRRWGSCDHKSNIVCNLFLMQLPWDLIDYVLLHELTHTRHLNHSSDFWQTMATVLPDVTERRQQLRKIQPTL